MQGCTLCTTMIGPTFVYGSRAIHSFVLVIFSLYQGSRWDAYKAHKFFYLVLFC
uniref:Uncharacterized protein n=1 Tax=Arundo donax TaxID=35708 RepID=A0A0A9BGA7_ARUDO